MVKKYQNIKTLSNCCYMPTIIIIHIPRKLWIVCTSGQLPVWLPFFRKSHSGHLFACNFTMNFKHVAIAGSAAWRRGGFSARVQSFQAWRCSHVRTIMTISSFCKRLSLDSQTDPCLCCAKEKTECKSETADFSVRLHFHSAMAMTSGRWPKKMKLSLMLIPNK